MRRNVKKIVFYVIMFVVTLSTVEISSWILWIFVFDGDRYVYNYGEQYESAGRYVYNREIGMIFPEPNTEIVGFCSEWIDRYPTVPLGDLGVGVFDDGIDKKRPIKALAFGDSFTRGAGSFNNIKFGWVEHIENLIPELDVLNLGGQGTPSPEQQFRYYRGVADLLEYDLVILNFWTGGDFEENALPYDMNVLLKRLPDFIDATEFLKRIQKEAVFDAGCDELLNGFFRPYSFRLMGKILDKIPSLPDWLCRVFPDCPTARKKKSITDSGNGHFERFKREIDARKAYISQPPIARDIYNWLQKNKSLAYIDYHLGMRVTITATALDETWGDKAAKYSARTINAFFNYAKERNKKFLLIIHPSKLDIFHNLFSNKTDPRKLLNRFFLRHKINTMIGSSISLASFESVKSINPEFRVDRLKAYLDKGIPVLDLAPFIRNEALESSVPLFWAVDAHYTPAGYAIAAQGICRYLREHELMLRGYGAETSCCLPDEILIEAGKLSSD